MTTLTVVTLTAVEETTVVSETETVTVTMTIIGAKHCDHNLLKFVPIRDELSSLVPIIVIVTLLLAIGSDYCLQKGRWLFDPPSPAPSPTIYLTLPPTLTLLPYPPYITLIPLPNA
jgi:hypothetical protein